MNNLSSLKSYLLTYSLGYMQLQQGMSDVFSLLGFCEIAKRFFKNGLLKNYTCKVSNCNISLLFDILIGQKLTVINLKLFCKVVTNQSATGKLRKCIKVPML